MWMRDFWVCMWLQAVTRICVNKHELTLMALLTCHQCTSSLIIGPFFLVISIHNSCYRGFPGGCPTGFMHVRNFQFKILTKSARIHEFSSLFFFFFFWTTNWKIPVCCPDWSGFGLATFIGRPCPLETSY